MQEVTVELINNEIERFNKTNGCSEEVLKYLFKNPDHNDYNAVFCRVGLLDSLYSTGIQRYNKGGITAVTDHFCSFSDKMNSSLKMDIIDFQLYWDLVDVKYSHYSDLNGRECKIYSFVSKYLSFCKPMTYPIMDLSVKKLMGISEYADYEEFCNYITEYRNKINTKLGMNYTVKEIDMFLWQLAKDIRLENNHEEN